jgi:hypothetical protein
VLAEDAMLIYRTSRAPERRVFKVFVGNMDDKDVEAYVQRVANKFKRDQVVDKNSGNVDLRFNQMAVDQDYFIPVRDPAAANPIDTLPGAQNLAEIADIEYIQKKLVTALRIPKAYLGFEEVVGDGKNLSLLDIRFARTINRIQKSVIAELNKIAIIHLFLMGFEDELQNFSLGLTNPSKQADLLMIDVWKEKVLLYKDLVAEIPKSLQATSATWAKKHIFGFSDEEIKLELQQVRMERAVSAELDNTATIITKTGLFDNIDRLYKAPASGSTAPAPAGPVAQVVVPGRRRSTVLLEGVCEGAVESRQGCHQRALRRARNLHPIGGQAECRRDPRGLAGKPSLCIRTWSLAPAKSFGEISAEGGIAFVARLLGSELLATVKSNAARLPSEAGAPVLLL